MSSFLELNNVSKKYHTPKGEIEAIKNISFTAEKGEIIGIVGSSGCGKSTLLNILDGLDTETSGTITKASDKTSYMLQSDALLPWLNVLDNACIGLKISKQKNKANVTYVKNLLTLFGLEKFIDEMPNNLSGGMKQRVGCIL